MKNEKSMVDESLNMLLGINGQKKQRKTFQKFNKLSQTVQNMT